MYETETLCKVLGRKHKVPRDVVIARRLLTEILTSEPRSVPAICKDYKLPVRFVEQIARKLRLAGLIKAKKGPGGGIYKEAV